MENQPGTGDRRQLALTAVHAARKPLLGAGMWLLAAVAGCEKAPPSAGPAAAPAAVTEAVLPVIPGFDPTAVGGRAKPNQGQYFLDHYLSII